MSDLDAWLDDYKPYETSARVCGRADLIAAHSRAEAELAIARVDAADVLGSRGLAKAKRVVEEIQAKIEASQREFTFRGLGNRAFQDLKRQHPPEPSDKDSGVDVHMDTFAPALIAASSLEPVISEAQATRMMEQLPIGEFQKLFDTAFQASGQVVGTPKSVLAAFIENLPRNGDSSTIALPEESPDHSSLAGNDDRSTGQSGTTPEV